MLRLQGGLFFNTFFIMMKGDLKNTFFSASKGSIISKSGYTSSYSANVCDRENPMDFPA